MDAARRRLQRRRRRRHQGLPRRPAVLRARHAPRRRRLPLRLDPQRRRATRYGESVGEFEQDEQYVRGLRRLVARLERRLGPALDRRCDVPARSGSRKSPAQPSAGRCRRTSQLAYPWLGFDLVEDVYEERTNQDQIERTEDVLLGCAAGATHRLRVGIAGIGSRRAACSSAYAQNGWDFGRERSLFVTTVASGRVENDGLRNAVLSRRGAVLRAYLGAKTKFFATVNGTVTEAARRGPAAAARRRGRACAAIRCATRRARHARC